MSSFDGLWYGTLCEKLAPVALASSGLLVEWLRADRRSYSVREVMPAQCVTLRQSILIATGATSFILIYAFSGSAPA